MIRDSRNTIVVRTLGEEMNGCMEMGGECSTRVPGAMVVDAASVSNLGSPSMSVGGLLGISLLNRKKLRFALITHAATALMENGPNVYECTVLSIPFV